MDHEKNFLEPELVELEKSEVNRGLIKEGEVAKKTKKKDLINI